MLNLYCKIRALLAQDRGVTAVEYGLILAAIVIAVGALVFGLGTQIGDIFTKATNSVQGK